MTLVALLGLVACSDYGLGLVPEPQPAFDSGIDTAAPAEPALDTGVDPDPNTGCETFTFCWTPALAGSTTLSGEFQSPSGEITVPWQDWAQGESFPLCASWQVCGGFRFRGSGAVDTNGDGSADAWTCVRQGVEESYAFTGDITLTLGDEALAPEIAPAPDSDGCGLMAEAP